MDRATFVFKLQQKRSQKTFSSALPRMEAVREVVDLKLEAKVEDDGSVSAPFLSYQTTTTTIITFSCVFFTLGRRKWLHSSHQELRLRRRPPFSTFYSSAVFCSLLLEEDGLEPPLSTRKTFVPHNFHIATNSRDCWEKNVDFRHEVSFRILCCWSL